MTLLLPSYRKIPLGNRLITKVSPEDFEWLSQWKWSPRWNERLQGFYAVRTVTTLTGKSTLRMHRFIMGVDLGDPTTVDHRNLDSLDNQRHNLRLATQAEQQRNRRCHRDSQVKFKGVTKTKCNRYIARIFVNGKNFNLGTRSTPEEAAVLYREAALEFYGEFARW